MEQFIQQNPKESSVEEAFKQLNSLDMEYFKFRRAILINCVCEIFKRMNFVTTFNINEKKLLNFATEVAIKYQLVPYHNFTHAFNILHFIYYVINNTCLSQYLSSLEIFGMFVAAIAHDIGHIGINNSYKSKMGSIVAKTVNDQSVLEHYHAYSLFHTLD